MQICNMYWYKKCFNSWWNQVGLSTTNAILEVRLVYGVHPVKVAQESINGGRGRVDRQMAGKNRWRLGAGIF
jgi:hypothetical protein